MKVWVPLLGGAMLAVSACASGPALHEGGAVTVVDGDVLPPPLPSDITLEERPYVFGPSDRISIEVYGVDALSRAVQADSNGRIALPLVGELKISGLTPREVAAEIKERLVGTVRDPQVIVNLVESVSRQVTVDGEVEQPGMFPIMGRMTLMQAIAKAEGATEFARLSHVVVFRTVGGQELAALYDVRAIRTGLYSDPEIFANDIIVVGESQAQRIFRSVIEGSTLLTAPIIAVLQR